MQYQLSIMSQNYWNNKGIYKYYIIDVMLLEFLEDLLKSS